MDKSFKDKPISKGEPFQPKPRFRIALPPPRPVPRDFIADEIIEKAEQGDPDAQYNLALLYDYGVGVEQNLHKRFELLEAAARQKHPEAIAMLGAHYYLGTHTAEKNKERGITYFKRAAALGNDCAITNLGIIEFFNHNSKKALEYLLQAESMGNSRAQLALALVYLCGYDDIERDYDKGLKYLEKANDCFLSDAALLYGLLYNSGEYCFECNQEIAAQYMLKALHDMKYPTAPLLLAAYYMEGNIIEKNIERARAFISDALKNFGDNHNFHTQITLFAPFTIFAVMNDEKEINDLKQSDALEDKILLAKRFIYSDINNVKYGLNILKPLAEDDCVEAQALLGDYYSYNDDIYSKESAQFWYKQAAKKGNAHAQANYAHTLKSKFGLYLPEALDWAMKSAKQDYAYGYYVLGEILFEGHNHIKRDHAKALEYLYKALELKTIDHLYFNWTKYAYEILGRIYLEGDGVPKDEKKAFEMFSKGRDYGSNLCEYYVSMMYEKGIYVEQDGNRAANILWALCVRENFIYAQKLANFYIEGKYVKRDINYALFILKEALNNGYTIANFDIAKIYFAGFDKHRNPKDGLEFLKALTSAGEPSSLFTYGLVLDLGYLLDKTDDYALSMYKLAVGHGSFKAMVNLSVKYLKGEGCPVNESEAFKLCSRAAAESIPIAEANLGLMYKYGIGTSEDAAKANEYFKAAASHGDSWALAELNGEIVHDESDKLRHFRKIVVQDYLNFEELVNGTYKTPTDDDPITQDPIPLHHQLVKSQVRDLGVKVVNMSNVSYVDTTLTIPDDLNTDEDCEEHFMNISKIIREYSENLYGKSQYGLMHKKLKNISNDVMREKETEEFVEKFKNNSSKMHTDNSGKTTIKSKKRKIKRKK